MMVSRVAQALNNGTVWLAPETNVRMNQGIGAARSGSAALRTSAHVVIITA